MTEKKIFDTKKLYISGVNECSVAHFLSQYILTSNEKSLLVILNDNEIDSVSQDIKTFLDNKDITVLEYPSDDEAKRIITLSKMSALQQTVVVADKESIDKEVLTFNALQDNTITLKVNNGYKYSGIITTLSKIGYSRENFVEDKGQFSVRGDILDIWPCDNENPIRITFDFETVETIKTFDYISQRSQQYLDEITILPYKIVDTKTTLLDQLNNNFVVYCDDEIEKDSRFDKFKLIINDPLNKKSIHYNYQSFQGFQGDIKYFIGLIQDLKYNAIPIKIYCSNEPEKQKMVDLFYENGWEFDDIPAMTIMPLWHGFYLKEEVAIISTKEILYKRKQISFPKMKSGKRLEGIWEISAGDYVVHEKYGIGKYKGLKKISQSDKTAEYLCIEYRKGDKLYVPPDDFKVVQKYIGVEGVKPKLYSMDTFAWERVKHRAREEASAFAKELLKLYAQRAQTQRQPYPQMSLLEKDLADSFAYEETTDQLKAIEDINNDFSKPYPMERLICGDVGFGKTEVALRAAFKVVCQSKQVALLVPTTVLAEQHYNTFVNRLAAFPAKVEVISRFQKPAQQKKILQELKAGNIDIIVGTHRLLQKDVEFKNLGLLIIDEEHRFGVKQKEKIKQMKQNIDILMLSATPIPRTLSGALYGLRDLSLIETQPYGRLPIETNIAFYDSKLIKNIIEAELSRNGQVFYVYNRVETILNKADEIKKLLPDIRLDVIHGQMKPAEIEKVMWRFLHRELDVLIATTIIESGIDIPTVNTMIIEDAQNFGLSQLHQLRGRIGREKQKAYCYLFYKEKDMNDDAIKRLEAMKNFSELGSGYKIALKDLEIRGAGGILSAKQHGFVRDIGYEMFARLLEEEGHKVRGVPQKEDRKHNVEVDIYIDAYIPQDYIEDEDIRILFYRKISNIYVQEEIDEIRNELLDRFGKIPENVENLFKIAQIKINASKIFVERISEDKRFCYIYFRKDTNFDKIDSMRFITDYNSLVEFNRTDSFSFKLVKSKIYSNFIDYIIQFLKEFKKYMK
ncbi:MAG: transcription-repair coupling factor [Elusimicrobia bacterium]|nr:transcription-repair coupling factor [Elusimicrobiota bacterium]